MQLSEEQSVSRVLTNSNALCSSDLRSLFRHECCAVHVKGFFPRPAARLLAQRLTNRDLSHEWRGSRVGSSEKRLACSGSDVWKVATGRGLESTDVRTVSGTPFVMAMNAARSKHGGLDSYFQEVHNEIRWLRESGGGRAAVDGDAAGSSSATLLSPLDKLRLELDECWPGGATLLKDSAGRPYLPGVGRLMQGPTRWADGFAHVDELTPLRTDRGLFSANVYLEVPPTGGELHIWNVAWVSVKLESCLCVVPIKTETNYRTELSFPSTVKYSRWDFYRHAATLSLLTNPNEEAQRQLRGRLPPPLRIRPEAGDLIVICAQRPHAVQGFPIGNRVSLQSFITHEGARKPLSIDN